MSPKINARPRHVPKTGSLQIWCKAPGCRNEDYSRPAAATSSPDAALIRNVLAVHHWYDAIRKGATIGDVAKREKVTTSRIQHMIGLAFLAPEIVGQIAAGTQPIGFT